MTTETSRRATPPPGPGASPSRNVRVGDDLWDKACTKAREVDGESISAIIRAFLRDYVRD